VYLICGKVIQKDLSSHDVACVRGNVTKWVVLIRANLLKEPAIRFLKQLMDNNYFRDVVSLITSLKKTLH